MADDFNYYAATMIYTARCHLVQHDVVSRSGHDAVEFIHAGKVARIDNLFEITRAFVELDASAIHVGDAIGSYVPGFFGIEHEIPTHEITLIVCGGQP